MAQAYEMTRFGEWLMAQDFESAIAVTRAVDAPQQHFQQWVTGQRKPTPKQIADLAAMFGTTEDHLYHLLGKIPPDIEAGLKHATPDVFRAVRLYL